MMLIKTEVWPSLYQDSVILMQIASKIRLLEGIDEAAAFMGTEGNQALLKEIGLETTESLTAGPNDVILTLRAETEANAAAAFVAARQMLSEKRRSDEDEGEALPKSLDSALKILPDANLAAISVPGAFVKFEAMRALRRNLNVFLFSDNVSVEDEIELKAEALKRGLLCMGPDCGTAYLSGQGIGFFNVVARGRIGCIAASGTGLQAVASRIAALGGGLSHGIGVGGRDLSAAVGGVMTLFALEALAGDPETEVIVLISKPPHPDVMARIEAALERIDKPTVVCCLGAPKRVTGRAIWVGTLDEAADAAVAFLRNEKWVAKAFSDPQAARARLENIRNGEKESLGTILGLYTGGTLAHEAHLILEDLIGEVAFNGRMADDEKAHRIIDLGDDIYTVGRPHPMIAPETRSEMIRKAGRLPDLGVLLFDLVLGRASHENPAQPLAESYTDLRKAAEAEGRRVVAVASVVGTSMDPQNLDGQTRQLAEAGILLFPTNSEAARFVAMVVKPELAKEFLEGTN